MAVGPTFRRRLLMSAFTAKRKAAANYTNNSDENMDSFNNTNTSTSTNGTPNTTENNNSNSIATPTPTVVASSSSSESTTIQKYISDNFYQLTSKIFFTFIYIPEFIEHIYSVPPSCSQGDTANKAHMNTNNTILSGNTITTAATTSTTLSSQSEQHRFLG